VKFRALSPLVGAALTTVSFLPSLATSQRQPLPGRAAPATPVSPTAYDSSAFAALHWREIGPFRGGRSVAVAGSSKATERILLRHTGGGVFKTTDGGITWAPVTEQILRRHDRAIGISGVESRHRVRRGRRVSDSRQRVARRRSLAHE